MKIKLVLLIASMLFSLMSQAQNFQTLRGKVVDDATKSPLPGANVIILDSSPLKGTVTDANGNFSLDQLAIGRVSIKVSYVGYNDKYYNNLELFAGKETVIEVQLLEKIISANEVVITAEVSKERPKNEMATVSARTFSIEETQRFAGALGDPSRMAQNFAGVMSAGDSRNDIIIRGNSPMGLLWRMEGIDIPNPNHFGASGTTGGPVSILNNNLLANSDFFTGAFPAEYGNALSGVFDLQMRNGNNQKYEFVGQIGFNGVELGAEGPFSKKHNASYLIDYRYSTLAFFDALGLKSITGSSVPQYQDLTFKINLPTKNSGQFVLFGIGGTSFIQIWDSKKEDDEASYGLAGTDTDFGSDMGVLGLYHIYYFNNKTRIKTNVSVSGSRARTKIDSLVGLDKIKSQYYRSSNSEVKYSISTHLIHKFNAKNVLTAGIILDRYEVNFIDSVYRWETQDYFKHNNSNGSLSLYQASSQWKHRISNQLSFTIGLHYQFFDLNSSQALEPRAGMEYQINEKQQLSFGYGYLSQTQPKVLYFVESELNTNESIKTNTDLGFTQSQQFVLAYNHHLKKNLRFKAEAYYQSLSNVPVSQFDPNYSALNEGAAFYISLYDSLINKGTGTNYGLELTLEKFLSKRFYVLGTASLFSSRYKGYNQKVHPTAFDNKYVLNALAGYELPLRKNWRMNFDIRTVYAGGKPYTPIDEAASLAQNQSVLIEEEAFSQQYNDYLRIDLKISFRMNMGRTDHEYALEIQNLTNHQNVFQQVWDPINKTIKTDYQQGFFPMFMYRIYF